MKKRILLLICCLAKVVFTICLAQTSPLPNIDLYRPYVNSPATPQASGTFTFSPYEVDKTSGIANINVPFYTIQAGNINLNIGVSYITKGIKVQDIASGIGLGWTLNAGICITVQKENTAYPYSLRFFKTQNSIENWSLDETLLKEVYQAFNHYYPALRTIYNFKAGAYSCSFYRNDNAQWTILTPEKEIRIISIGNQEEPDGFKITTPDGIQYLLDQKEKTQELQTSYPGKGEYVSAYWISGIYDPKTGKSVDFSYKSKQDQIYTDSESFIIAGRYDVENMLGYVSLNPALEIDYNNTRFRVKSLQLDRIDFPDGRIQLFTEDTRPEVDKTKIKSIRLSSHEATIKDMVFHQSYFNGLRLKLDSITIQHPNASQYNDKTRYRFEYDPTNLPNYKTTALAGTETNFGSTDFWGYYNGTKSGPTVPEEAVQPYKHIGFNFPQQYLRSYFVNPILSQSAILKSVIYPNGGRAVFEYENNVLSHSATRPTDTFGGHRVKRISYFPYSGDSISIIRSFEYIKGLAMGPPLAIKERYSYTGNKAYMLEARTYLMRPDSKYKFFNIYGNSLSPYVYHNGSPVFYTEVAEYLGTKEINNGKIVSNFLGNNGHGIDYTGLQISQYGSYKYIYDGGHTRGQLVSNAIYLKSGNSYVLQKVDSNSYLFDRGNFIPPYYQVGLAIEKNPAFRGEYVGPGAASSYHTWGIGNSPPMQRTEFHAYDINTPDRSVLLNGTKSILFNNSSLTDSVVTNKQVFYDGNSNNITRVEYLDSEGRRVKLVYKYLSDSLSISEFSSNDRLMFGYMKNLNSRNDIIEKDEYIDNMLNVRERNYYSAILDSILNLPVPRITRSKTTFFSAGTTSSTITTFLKDKYDNVIQKNTLEKLPESFLFDDRGVNLIAQSQSQEIAYTSFERDAMGKWDFNKNNCVSAVDAFTGSKVYNLTTSSPISFKIQEGKQYVVSYWSKNGIFAVTGSSSSKLIKSNGTWTLYEHEINVSSGNTVSISGSGVVDEVRLFPLGNQLITYTYKNLIGVSSIGSSNSDYELYQYDDAGRLKFIKDEDGNLKSSFQYNTYDPSRDKKPFWRITGNVRCQQSSPGINTGYQEREEIDRNTKSTSFDHTRWVVVEGSANGCPIGNVMPDWRRTGNIKCSSDPWGFVEAEERDFNTLSPTYNTLQWVKTEYNTMACPIPRYGFTVWNTTYGTIYITVTLASNNELVGSYYVYPGISKIIDTFPIEYFNFHVSNGTNTSPNYKIFINNYLQNTPGNTVRNMRTNSPLTLKVEN